MASPSPRFARLLSRLPFALDDTDQVNAAFQRWRNEGAEEAKQVADLWAYCFVLRYFMMKEAKGDIGEASSVDALTDTAFQRVLDRSDTVREAGKFASWVSVVCRNTFLNYVRRRKHKESIDEEGGPVLVADVLSDVDDVGFTAQMLAAAIDRLPSYLQEVAELYFFEGYEYQEISSKTGKSVATVRSYRHKVVKKLREDEDIAAFLEEIGRASEP
jgi:RNA polymerase sigma factor (sigma-70 family)